MNIKESQSVLTLFVESFKIVNRSIGKLLLLGLIYILLSIALSALFLLHIPFLLIKLAMSLLSVLLTVVFIKMIAAVAENKSFSIPGLMTDSVFPAIYTVILQLIGVIVGAVFGLLASIIGGGMHSYIIPGLFALAGIFLFLRFCFAPLIIAIQDENPITALMNSWQLTGEHCGKTVVCWLVPILSPSIFVLGCGYGLYVGIPLYFANSFDLTHLSLAWILVFLLLFVLFILISLAISVLWVLVFLNLTYEDAVPAAEPAVALPQTKITGTEGKTLPAGQTQNDDAQSQVFTISVKSQESEGVMEQHLEQVYQPKPEDITPGAEEDRMPTILFDDEMAKQMEADRAKWEEEKKKAQSKQDGDENPIKMSK